MKYLPIAMMLLLPHHVLAGTIFTWIEGDEESLLAGTSGPYDHQSHDSNWSVDTSDLSSDGLPFHFTFVDEGIVGFIPGSGTGGNGLITITDLPLKTGELLVFSEPVVLLQSYSHIFLGANSLVRNKLEVISGVALNLDASSIELEFVSDTEFVVTGHFEGTIIEDYVVVPEPATALLLIVGGTYCLIKRRR